MQRAWVDGTHGAGERYLAKACTDVQVTVPIGDNRGGVKHRGPCVARRSAPAFTLVATIGIYVEAGSDFAQHDHQVRNLVRLFGVDLRNL